MPDTLRRHEPLPRQIYDIYARRIAAGTLPSGAKLPPVRKLAALHQVAVNVAAEAVKLLAAEGLVITTRGRGGTIVAGAEVAAPRLILGPQQRFGWAHPLPGEHAEVLSAGMEKAPPHVAAELRLTEVPRHGFAPVYRRQQLIRYPDGTPKRLEVSWFHPRWAARIKALASETEPVLPSLGGVAALIAGHARTPVVRGRHWVEARPALDDEREVPLLGISEGYVLLAATYTWERLVPDPDNKGQQLLEVIEYGEYDNKQHQVLAHEYDVAPPPATP